MSEWWSYGLSDFLMFSPSAYWRLVERYNLAWWPAQLTGLLAAAGLLVLAVRPRPGAQRTALLVAAAAWAWVGWAFHWQRYAELFLAAPWLAGACWVQAGLLVAAALLRPREQPSAAHPLPWTAAAIIALGMAYPLLAVLEGRPWAQAEVFGWMPEPTALVTLGLLVALRGCAPLVRAGLAVLPLLSLALGGATRWLFAQ
jgi:hypothetical protein